MLKYQEYPCIFDNCKCTLKYDKVLWIWQRHSNSHGFHYFFVSSYGAQTTYLYDVTCS